jgi:site-specific recombinase XerD
VTDLAPVLQGFFTDRLARQKKASPNTVAAYRDTCRLLLAFAQTKTGKAPSQFSLADLDATLIGEFLHHLEEQRGTLKSSGGTEAPPATPAWPRSTRCSSTQPPRHPSTPP